MRLVFWQNLLAFHQAPYIRSLATRHEVVWVVEEVLSVDRQALGWNVPDAGNAKVVISPGVKEIQGLIEDRPTETIHIFLTIHGFPMVERAFYRCLKTKAKMGLLVENREDRGWRAPGRLLLYWSDYFRFNSRISFILCMGYDGPHGGRNYYRQCGFPDAKIFPYGYFVDPPAQCDLIQDTKNGPVRLMYLGQCIRRKGLDILLKSLSHLETTNWNLKIVGDGVMKQAWVQQSERLGIGSRVNFLPAMANEEAMKLVAESDLFVLPSRFDGWGVVVNEALLRGVPVICSDRCGASDLLKAPWRGETFQADSVSDLRRVLSEWIHRGQASSEVKQRIKAWSSCLSGEMAAKYLLAVFDHCFEQGPRPAPPWFS